MSVTPVEPGAVQRTQPSIRAVNVALPAAGRAVALLVGAVTTPLIARQLGPEGYGAWTLISVLLGYTAFADLGMGVASTRFGADAHARNDDAAETEIVWVALAITAGCIGLVGLACLAFAPQVLRAFLHVSPSVQPQIEVGLRFAFLGFIGTACAGVVNTPQIVRHRFDTNVGINTGVACIQAVSYWVVLARHGGVVELAMVAAVMGLASVPLQLAFSHRLQPKLLPPRFSLAHVKPLLGFGRAIVLSGLVGIVIFSGEKVLLTRYSSIASLAYYALAFAIAQPLDIIPNALIQPLLPTFTSLVTQHETERLRRYYTFATRLVALVTVPAAILLCGIATPLIILFINADYARNAQLPLCILAVGYFCSGIGWVSRTLLLAYGEANTVARIHLLELAPYIVGALFLVQHFGVAGAALAWTARNAVEAAVLCISASRKIGSVRREMGRGITAFALSALLILIPIASGAAHVLPPGPALVLTLVLLPAAAVVGARGLTADERRLIAARTAGIRHRLAVLR